MSGMQRGEWRVVGRNDERGELLLRPVAGDATVPGDVDVGGCLAVSTNDYGGALQDLVDELRPGNLVRARAYPGRPGRLVDAELVGEMRLYVGRDSGVPDFVAELWTKATENRSSDDPIAVSTPLDVGGGSGEVHVVQATADREDDLWWSFVSGDGGESIYGSFEHADGVPAEAVAVRPNGLPYFYVLTFDAIDTDAARTLRTRLGRSSEEQIEGLVRDLEQKLRRSDPNVSLDVRATN